MKRLCADLTRLLTQIREDWQIHDRDWTKPGFRALAVHRLGNWNRGAGLPVLLRKAVSLLYLLSSKYVRNHYGIELPLSTIVGRRVVLAHQHGIVIHPFAEIGDDCVIRQNVTIGAVSQTRLKGAPKIGHRVQIGCGAVIVGKVIIGDGATIGPNTVVMTNVPSGATVFVESPRVVQLSDARVVSEMSKDVRAGT